LNKKSVRGGSVLDRARKKRVAKGAISVANSRHADLDEAVDELKTRLGDQAFVQILVFFSVNYSPDALADRLSKAFPGVPVCGCSGAGGIAPTGFVDDGLVAIGFPASNFRVVSALVEDISQIGFERTYQSSLALRAQLHEALDTWRRERLFGLMFVDGISNREEKIVAAVRAAIHDFPIVGASAGDGLSFDNTSLIWNGHAVRDAAIILLFETDFEFRVFRTQSFEAKESKLVVTVADVESRTVHELNAEPAAAEYARTIGLHPSALTPMTFALHPVVVKAGADIYCRSIRKANDDGSLTFFCAIDEGLVLRVAESKDLVETTRETLEAIQRDLKDISITIGFECILRKLEGQAFQELQAIEDVYRDHRVVGFHTYGEQFNAMHLNQTLTGIAIGANLRT
jgi:hypothetical protein